MGEILNGPKILPENNNKVKNAVVFLHGYGANGNDLINIGFHWKDVFSSYKGTPMDHDNSKNLSL